LSQWDGPRFQSPYQPTRQSSWALPVILVLVGVLGIIGIGYGVLKVTRPEPATSEGLPTGDEASAGGPGLDDDPAHSMPSAPTLLGKCRAASEEKNRAVAAKSTFRVAYRDEFGYAVWIGSTAFEQVCAYKWNGDTADFGGIGWSRGAGAVPPTAGDTVDIEDINAISFNGRTGLSAKGTVPVNVRRVRVKWAGGFEPSEAAVNHGWFLVQGIQSREPDGKAIGPGCEVETYDQSDNLLAHVPCSSL
jgi:hypothetical protein